MRTGQTSAQAIAASLALVRRADELGFRRYWFAEHHNMPAVAASTPPVMIAAAAAVTERVRVGSGGVMLPNHAPLVVAEQFAALEALAPGRVDLGLGRAPGSDPVITSLLPATGQGQEAPGRRLARLDRPRRDRGPQRCLTSWRGLRHDGVLGPDADRLQVRVLNEPLGDGDRAAEDGAGQVDVRHREEGAVLVPCDVRPVAGFHVARRPGKPACQRRGVVRARAGPQRERPGAERLVAPVPGPLADTRT